MIIQTQSMWNVRFTSHESEASPLVFPPCLRGPGRPNKRREGAPAASKRQVEPHDEEPAPKKRRGRPPGSRNKTKEKSHNIPSLSIRERAEMAADFELEENESVCKICNFALDDPIKVTKRKITWPDCKSIVHQLCFLNYGYTCANRTDFQHFRSSFFFFNKYDHQYIKVFLKMLHIIELLVICHFNHIQQWGEGG